LRAIGWIAGMASALTLAIGGMTLLVPEILARDADPLKRTLCLAPCVLPALLVISYICAFLECSLSATMAGHARGVAAPGRDLRLIVKCGATWIVCFLAGPAVIAAVAFLFWMNCGDPAPVDWLILAELGVVAVGYWLFCLVSVVRADRLLDANPERVGAVLAMLGFRALVVAAAGSAIVLGHGLLALMGAHDLHRDPDRGWLLLAFACISGLFWATFLFRVLGVWCHLREKRG
jgi:hypothetical protein